MARAKKLLSPLPGACCLTRGIDFANSKFLTENKKIDEVDYVGLSEGCISHLARLNLHEDNFDEDIEDLHFSKTNTRSYERISIEDPTISRYSLVPFFFLSREHLKKYLYEKILRMIFNIFKTTLSSYFPNNFNHSKNKKKNQIKKS